MNFTSDMAHAIFAGRKTETRRPVRPGEERPRWRPGQDLAVCPGQGREAIGRIVVVQVERQRLGDLRTEDAIAEGCGGRHPVANFARRWLGRYDASYREALVDATDDEVLDRWRGRYSAQQVWVITFIPDPTAGPRLLAARSELGYTRLPHQAVQDEPEAVDASTQEALTAAVHRREADARADAGEHLSHHLDDLRRRISGLRHTARVDGLTPRTIQALRQAEAQLRRAEAESKSST